MSKKICSIVSMFTAIFLIFAVSCTKAEKSGIGTGGTDVQDDGVISFYNDLLAFSKDAREPLDKISDTMDDSVEWIENDRVFAAKPMWNIALAGSIGFKRIPEKTLAAPQAFSAEDKRFIDDRIAAVKQNVKELIDIAASLQLYYSAEDYKDDKHQKIKDIEPKVRDMISAIHTACAESINCAGVYADEVERKNLEKNPVGIYILNMRDVMDKIGEQYSILSKEDLLYKDRSGLTPASEKAALVVAHKGDVEAIEALTAEIDALVEKGKNQDTAALKEISTSLVSEYEDFFKDYEMYKGEVRKAVRDLKENGTHDSLYSIESEYKSIIGDHNSFIDVYNSL